MSEHYETIINTLTNYRRILKNTCPSHYYHTQCDKIECAIEWLNNQLEYLDDYRHEAREG